MRFGVSSCDDLCGPARGDSGRTLRCRCAREVSIAPRENYSLTHHRDGDVPRNGHGVLAGTGRSGLATVGLVLALTTVYHDIRFRRSQTVACDFRTWDTAESSPERHGRSATGG